MHGAVVEQAELLDTINAAIRDALVDLHTIMIAKITKVNAATIDCAPVISRSVGGATVDLPELVDVPPVTMQGGGSALRMPISTGDYCLVLITERCFDRWYVGQDNQPPLELRLHDYSDGFALVGVNPLEAALTIPSIMTIDGDLQHNGSYTGSGSVEAASYVDGAEYRVGGLPGASGVFVSQDGKTVTVTKGIVTDIVTDIV